MKNYKRLSLNLVHSSKEAEQTKSSPSNGDSMKLQITIRNRSYIFWTKVLFERAIILYLNVAVSFKVE